jgi:hypothetical protein
VKGKGQKALGDFRERIYPSETVPFDSAQGTMTSGLRLRRERSVEHGVETSGDGLSQKSPELPFFCPYPFALCLSLLSLLNSVAKVAQQVARLSPFGLHFDK